MILSALLLTAGVPDQLSADFDAFLFFLPALGRRLRLADYDHRLDFAASDAFLIFLLMIPGQKEASHDAHFLLHLFLREAQTQLTAFKYQKKFWTPDARVNCLPCAWPGGNGGNPKTNPRCFTMPTQSVRHAIHGMTH